MNSKNKQVTNEGYNFKDGFCPSSEVNILKFEYDNLRAEIRMQCEQFSSKFTILAVFVLGAFTFALRDPKFQFTFIMIPFLLYLVAYATLAQVYVIFACAGRIRMIEKRITELNNGNPILIWEHKLVKKLMLTFFIRLFLKDNKTKVFLSFINPIYSVCSVVVFVLTILLVYSCIKVYHILNLPWYTIYIVILSILYCGAFLQLISLFRLGVYFDDIDYDK